MPKDRVLMISGNGPDHACGVAHFTQRLLDQLVSDCPETSFVWLSRRAKRKQLPIALTSRLRKTVQLQPWHTWRPVSWHVAGAFMRLWRPRIVHIQDEIHSFHETRAAIELAVEAKRVGALLVVTLHEYHTELPSVKYTDELVSLADVVIVQDARNAQRCRERTGRVAAATGWSPANVDPPPTPVATVRNRLVTFGLLSRGKDLEVVYEALLHIRRNHPDLSWYIMGPFDPEGNDYHRELKRRFSEPWIVFTGGGTKEMAEPTFRRTLASGFLMLLPFADGASPRRTTLQAAWAFGLPTITTAPEVEETEIRDGDNCLLTPGSGVTFARRVSAWTSTIERAIDDSQLRERLSKGSRLASAAHSWHKLSEQHQAIYSKWPA
jgi:glycosyltransferase involved in cell wall biosynthesis